MGWRDRSIDASEYESSASGEDWRSRASGGGDGDWRSRSTAAPDFGPAPTPQAPPDPSMIDKIGGAYDSTINALGEFFAPGFGQVPGMGDPVSVDPSLPVPPPVPEAPGVPGVPGAPGAPTAPADPTELIAKRNQLALKQGDKLRPKLDVVTPARLTSPPPPPPLAPMDAQGFPVQPAAPVEEPASLDVNAVREHLRSGAEGPPPVPEGTADNWFADDPSLNAADKEMLRYPGITRDHAMRGIERMRRLSRARLAANPQDPVENELRRRIEAAGPGDDPKDLSPEDTKRYREYREQITADQIESGVRNIVDTAQNTRNNVGGRAVDFLPAEKEVAEWVHRRMADADKQARESVFIDRVREKATADAQEQGLEGDEQRKFINDRMSGFGMPTPADEDDSGFFAELGKGAVREAPAMVSELAGGASKLAGKAIGGDLGERLSSAGGQLSKRAESIREGNDPAAFSLEPGGGTEGIWTKASEGSKVPYSGQWWGARVGEQVPIFASMWATGNAPAAASRAQMLFREAQTLGTIGLLEGSQAAHTIEMELLEQGVGADEARNRGLASGLVVGVVNGALERVPYAQYFGMNKARMTGLSGAAKRLVGASSSEAATEALQEMSQIIAEYQQGVGEDITAEQVFDQLAQSAAVGAVMGGGMSATQQVGEAPGKRVANKMARSMGFKNHAAMEERAGETQDRAPDSEQETTPTPDIQPETSEEAQASAQPDPLEAELNEALEAADAAQQAVSEADRNGAENIDQLHEEAEAALDRVAEINAQRDQAKPTKPKQQEQAKADEAEAEATEEAEAESALPPVRKDMSDADIEAHVRALEANLPKVKPTDGSSAEDARVASAMIGGAAKVGGYKRTLEKVQKDGYVEFSRDVAADSFRKDNPGWVETSVDGKFRFEPPATKPKPKAVAPANTQQRHKAQDSWMTDEQKANRDATHSGQQVAPAAAKHQTPSSLIGAVGAEVGGSVTLPGGSTVEIVPYTGQEGAKGASVILNGGGRPVIVVKIDGVPVTFYQSTGEGGKDVQVGKWYPTPGVDGFFFNKTNGKDMSEYYGSQAMAETAAHLDALTGNVVEVFKSNSGAGVVEFAYSGTADARAFINGNRTLVNDKSAAGMTEADLNTVKSTIDGMLGELGEAAFFSPQTATPTKAPDPAPSQTTPPTEPAIAATEGEAPPLAATEGEAGGGLDRSDLPTGLEPDEMITVSSQEGEDTMTVEEAVERYESLDGSAIAEEAGADEGALTDDEKEAILRGLWQLHDQKQGTAGGFSTEPIASMPGKKGSLRTADGQSRGVTYAVVDANDLIPSHDARNKFSKNDRGDLNERPYDDAQQGADSRKTVENIASDTDFGLILSDTQTPTDGPPMIAPGGEVVGGNARAMGVQLAYSRGGESSQQLRQQVQEAAAKFGIEGDVASMESPMVVRVLDEPGQRGELSRVLNESLTATKSDATESVSRASKISKGTGKIIAAMMDAGEESASIREILGDDAKAMKLVRRFVKDGVWTEGEASKYVDPNTGRLTPAAKIVIEDTLVGRLIPDPSIAGRLPAGVKRKIVGALGPITRASSQENANLSDALTKAADAYPDYKASGLPVRDFFFDQQQLSPPPGFGDPVVAAIVHAMDTLGPRQFRAAAESYLERAGMSDPDAPTLDFGTDAAPQTPQAAAVAAFGGDLNLPDAMTPGEVVLPEGVPDKPPAGMADVVILLKPLGVELGAEGKMREFIAKHGGQVIDEWQGIVDARRIAEHYRDSLPQHYGPPMVKYMVGKEMVAVRVRIPKGKIKDMRKELGPSSAVEAGSLRQQTVGQKWKKIYQDTLAIDNAYHMSDSAEAGARESEVWFGTPPILTDREATHETHEFLWRELKTISPSVRFGGSIYNGTNIRSEPDDLDYIVMAEDMDAMRAKVAAIPGVVLDSPAEGIFDPTSGARYWKYEYNYEGGKADIGVMDQEGYRSFVHQNALGRYFPESWKNDFVLEKRAAKDKRNAAKKKHGKGSPEWKKAKAVYEAVKKRHYMQVRRWFDIKELEKTGLQSYDYPLNAKDNYTPSRAADVRANHGDQVAEAYKRAMDLVPENVRGHLYEQSSSMEDLPLVPDGAGLDGIENAKLDNGPELVVVPKIADAERVALSVIQELQEAGDAAVLEVNRDGETTKWPANRFRVPENGYRDVLIKTRGGKYVSVTTATMAAVHYGGRATFLRGRIDAVLEAIDSGKANNEAAKDYLYRLRIALNDLHWLALEAELYADSNSKKLSREIALPRAAISESLTKGKPGTSYLRATSFGEGRATSQSGPLEGSPTTQKAASGPARSGTEESKSGTVETSTKSISDGAGSGNTISLQKGDKIVSGEVLKRTAKTWAIRDESGGKRIMRQHQGWSEVAEDQAAAPAPGGIDAMTEDEILAAMMEGAGLTADAGTSQQEAAEPATPARETVSEGQTFKADNGSDIFVEKVWDNLGQGLMVRYAFVDAEGKPGTTQSAGAGRFMHLFHRDLETPSQEPKAEGEFKPRPGWRQSIFKAREFANHIGVEHDGLGLDDLVRAIDKRVFGADGNKPARVDALKKKLETAREKANQTASMVANVAGVEDGGHRTNVSRVRQLEKKLAELGSPVEPWSAFRDQVKAEPAKKAEPTTSDKAKAARQELDDALGDLGDLMKGRLGANQFADPEVAKAVLKVAAKAIKAGSLTFADTAMTVFRYLKSQIGDQKAREAMGVLAGPLEGGWDRLRQMDERLDESGNTLAIIDTEPTDERTTSDTERTGDNADDRVGGPVDDAAGVEGTDQAEPSERREREPGQRDERGVDDDGGGERGSRGSDVGTDERGPTDGAAGRSGERGSGQDRSATDVTERSADLTPDQRNFVIPPGKSLAPNGDTAKFNANIAALELLGKLEQESREATPDEKATLAKYTGWGFLKEAFNEEKADTDRYKKQFARLQKLVGDEVISQEDYDMARRYSFAAHFTDVRIAEAMWDIAQRLGFEGGTVLEPAVGSGIFVGTMPQSVAEQSDVLAIDADRLSARLSAKLYPQAKVLNEKYQDAKIDNNSVDLAITNVPFSGRVRPGREYPGLLLHDYYFARTLDKVRPGGIAIMISTHGTLDKGDRALRELVAEKADLVGAIRLPQNTFKQNAATDVTTDIIILRKKDGMPFEGQPWLQSVQVGEDTYIVRENGIKSEVTAPIYVNEYFQSNPKMAPGQHTLSGTRNQGKGGYELVAAKSQNTFTKVKSLVENLPENIMGERSAAEIMDERGTIEAETGDPEWSYIERDGEFYHVEDGKLVKAAWLTHRNKGDKFDEPLAPVKRGKKRVTVKEQVAERKELARQYLDIRDAVRDLLVAEREDRPDAEIEAARKRLNEVYDKAIKANGKKTLNHRASQYEPYGFMIDDSMYPLVLSVEESYTKKDKSGKAIELYRKGDIFDKRIFRPIEMPTSADNINDALDVSLSFMGSINTQVMADLLGVTKADARAQALETGRTFVNPETGLLETRDKYLSGNVRKKLRQAKSAAESDADMKRNVEGLEKVQPEDVILPDIYVTLSARWMPTEITEAFADEVLRSRASIQYVRAINKFAVRGSESAQTRAMYGTEARSAMQLLESKMNGTEIKITRTVGTGQDKRTVVDVEATQAANDKADQIEQAYKDWILSAKGEIQYEGETTTVGKLAQDLYNETHNAVVPPTYDGSYLTLPGVNENEVYKRPFRMAAIARVLQDGSAVIAHGVGSGKTYTLISAAMEMRRLGLANKPMIVVQKATIGQFSTSFMKAYPNARILVANEKSFSAKHRHRFMARAQTGDYDAIILAHSHFDRIPDSEEQVRRYFGQQIAELRDLLTDTRATDGDQSSTVAEIEQAIEDLENKMQDRINELQKNQDKRYVMPFDEIGADAILIDEAHNYKRLPIVTRMTRVKGIPTGFSQKAMGMQMKANVVHDRTGGRNVIGATGTPITNTMAEAYVMLKLFTPNVLDEYDIVTFDDFAHTFGQASAGVEFTWSGSFKSVTRFNQFVNIPELVNMIRSGFDVAIGNKELGLDVPEVEGEGEFGELVEIEQNEATEQIKDYILRVADVWDNLEGRERRENSWVPIVTMGMGTAGALDPRLVDPNLPDHPESKVNIAANNVFEIWEENKANKGTQLVFADRFAPMKMDKLEGFAGSITGGSITDTADALVDEDEDADTSEDQKAERRRAAEYEAYRDATGFNLYKDMRAKLIARGIPEDQIAIIHEANTDIRREALFAKVNAGEVRVLLGSTELMGVGVNVQEKLVVQHELDPPRMMTPAMGEQRWGRIVRQGHDPRHPGSKSVRVIKYGLKKSMDIAIMQLIAKKQKMITAVLQGDISTRTMEDVADEVEASMSTMIAALTGDPRVMRMVELQAEVQKMDRQQRAYQREQHVAEQDVDHGERLIQHLKKQTPKLEAIRDAVGEYVFKGDDGKYAWTMEVDGDTFDDRGDVIERIGGEIESSLADLRGLRADYDTQRDTSEFKINGGTVTLHAIPVSGTYSAKTLGFTYTTSDGMMLREGQIDSSGGLLAQLQNIEQNAQNAIEANADRLPTIERDIEPLREKAAAGPWPQSKELAAKRTELQKLENELEHGPGANDVKTGRAQTTEPRARKKPTRGKGRREKADYDPAGVLGLMGAPVRRDAAPVAQATEQAESADAAPSRIAIDPIQPEAGAKPVQLSDMKIHAGDVVGRRVRTGKVPRSLAAYYDPASGDINVRHHGDLDSTIHEVSHALDDLYGIVAEWHKPYDKSPYDAELAAFWVYGSVTKSGPRSRLRYKRAEGVAEFIRAWMVNPKAAEAAAPEFAKHFKETVPAAIRKQLRAMGDEIRTWAGQDEQAIIMSNVHMDQPTRGLVKDLREFARGKGYDFQVTAFDKLKSRVHDMMSPVWKAITQAKDMQGIAEQLPQDDAYHMMRVFAGVSLKVEDAVEYGMFSHDGDRVTGGLGWLFEPLNTGNAKTLEADVEGVVALLIGERVIEKAGILDKQVEAKVGSLLAAVEEGRITEESANRKIEALRAKAKAKKTRLAGYGATLLAEEKIAVGLIEKAKADPDRFARIEEGARRWRMWANANLRYLLDKGRISKAKYDKIKGSNEFYASFQRLMDEEISPRAKVGGQKMGTVGQPLHAFKGSTRPIRNPYINLMEQTASVIREADRNEAMGLFVRLLGTDRQMHEGEPLNLAEIGVRGKAGDKNAIRVFIDGKEQHWVFEENIYRSLKGLGEDKMGLGMKLMSALPRMMRYMITHSPDFIVRNVVRDSFFRYVVSKHNSLPTDVLKGFTKEELSEFHRAGGGQFGNYFNSRSGYYKLLKRTMRDAVGDKSSVIFAPVRFYGKAAAMSETVGRMAEYKRAKRHAIEVLGYDAHNARLYAAFEARNLLDYAVVGEWVQTINRLVPFTNAAYRGVMKAAEVAGENPKGFFGKMLVSTLPLSLLQMLWNGADDETEEEYMQQPAYLRDLFWNFKMGENTWVRIPKPFELGLIASGFERAFAAADGHENAFDGYGGSVARAMVPVDEQALAGPFRSIVEGMVNYDLFRDRYIVPPYENDLRLDLRSTDRGSRIGQLLQSMSNIDSRKIDHFIKSQFGGVGRIALNVSDIGREDRDMYQPLRSASGVVVTSPASASMDVQYVKMQAKERGKVNSPVLRPLRYATDKYYDAKTQAEKDRWARKMREIAARIRRGIDDGRIWRN